MRRGRKSRSEGGGGRGGNTKGSNRIERVAITKTITEYLNIHFPFISPPTFNINIYPPTLYIYQNPPQVGLSVRMFCREKS